MTRAETIARLTETLRCATSYGIRVGEAFFLCDPVRWTRLDVDIVACDARNAGHFGNQALDHLEAIERDAVAQARVDGAAW